MSTLNLDPLGKSNLFAHYERAFHYLQLDKKISMTMRFLVLVQVSVVIMIRYNENLLRFAICDIYVYLKNLADGEVVNDCVYISFYIHKIEKFTRMQPILKSNSTSFTLQFFSFMNIKKVSWAWGGEHGWLGRFWSS